MKYLRRFIKVDKILVKKPYCAYLISLLHGMKKKTEAFRFLKRKFSKNIY